MAAVSLEAIEKTHSAKGAPIPVLKNLNLSINPGEIYGIIGKKGSGKTTLLRCIARLDPENQGTIWINNSSSTNLSNTDLALLRFSMGLMTQETQLLNSKTVFDNIALTLELTPTLKTEIPHRVKPLLQWVGLEHKADALPASLNSFEKKRLALARALVHKPSLLLCDDPTLDLEPKSVQAFLQLLNEIHAKLKFTLIICSQDMDVIKAICHRVAVLDEGQIVEESDTKSLFLKPKSLLSKEWVKASTRLELPTALRKRLKPTPFESCNPVLRLAFSDKDAGLNFNNPEMLQETLIAHLIQHFYLSIHIMQAHLELLRDQSIAIMVVEVRDEHNTLEAAMQFLESQSLFVEVLGYATRTF